MPAPPPVTIFVHSTDAFSDCWDPFFMLLARYWPGCGHPVVLNTERKSYRHPGLDLSVSRVAEAAGSPRPTWSESLLKGLESVRTDIVLFMIDDFFIDGPVDLESLDYCLRAMARRGLSSIALTEHGAHRPRARGEDPRLQEVRQDAKYRLTTSPALWRVQALRGYLRPPENAWQFEVFGSWRARRRPDSLLVYDPGFLANGREGVIPYFQAAHDTGIVKGQWQRGIESLFDAHGIGMDYSRRGFHKPLPSLLNKYYLLRKLAANPGAILADWVRA
jgi:hypothetical protein